MEEQGKIYAPETQLCELLVLNGTKARKLRASIQFETYGTDSSKELPVDTVQVFGIEVRINPLIVCGEEPTC